MEVDQIWQGITIGAVGGGCAGMSIMAAGWLAQKVRDWSEA